MDDHLPQSSDHGTDVEFDKRTTQKERGNVQQEAWNYVTLCIYIYNILLSIIYYICFFLYYYKIYKMYIYIYTFIMLYTLYIYI